MKNAGTFFIIPYPAKLILFFISLSLSLSLSPVLPSCSHLIFCVSWKRKSGHANQFLMEFFILPFVRYTTFCFRGRGISTATVVCVLGCMACAYKLRSDVRKLLSVREKNLFSFASEVVICLYGVQKFYLLSRSDVFIHLSTLF